MEIPHRKQIKKPPQNRNTDRQLRRKDAGAEEQAKRYLNEGLAKNEKEGVVVSVVVFDQKEKRINLYGESLNANRLAYRLSIRSSNIGLHPSEWRHLTRSYRQGVYLVRRQELEESANFDEWVALVNVKPSVQFNFDQEVIYYRE